MLWANLVDSDVISKRGVSGGDGVIGQPCPRRLIADDQVTQRRDAVGLAAHLWPKPNTDGSRCLVVQ